MDALEVEDLAGKVFALRAQGQSWGSAGHLGLEVI